MGMNVEEVLGNVKDALVKAAKEGKKKGLTEGLTEGYKNSIDLIQEYKKDIDDRLDNLINTLTSLSTPDEEVDNK